MAKIIMNVGIPQGSEQSIMVARNTYFTKKFKDKPGVVSNDRLKKKADIIVSNGFEAYIIKDGTQKVFHQGKHPVFEKSDFGFLKLKTHVRMVELIFVRKGTKQRLLWGTPPSAIKDYDSATNVEFSLCGNGDVEIEIADSARLLQIAGNATMFTVSDLQDFVRGKIVANLRAPFLETIAEEKYDLMTIGRCLDGLAAGVKQRLNKLMFDEYGIAVKDFVINAMDLDPASKEKIIKKRGTVREKFDSREQDSYDRSQRERDEDRSWARVEVAATAEREIRKDYLDTVKEAGWQPEKSTVINGPGFTGVAQGENVCPRCGTFSKTSFCSRCGEKLAKKCPKCGAEATGGFCGSCGTSLK